MDPIAAELVSAEVASVVFVRDYVQLVLDADTDVRVVPEGMAGPSPTFAGRDISYLSLNASTDPRQQWPSPSTDGHGLA
jgi:hypothetical protein